MAEDKGGNKITQSQFYDLIISGEVSWQAIIYDLVKTEQLDPWDIDLGILAEKYREVIQAMEEADFFISSKVLLACSLLLRLKSELLLNKYLQDLDDLIYNRINEDKKKYAFERIEIDEDELPVLVPKTPLARSRRVTLKELMSALSQAIDTENRRIKREIRDIQAGKNAIVVMPKSSRIPLKSLISTVYNKIKSILAHPEKKEIKKITYSDISKTREEKLAHFLPILHLSNQDRLYLEQEKHLEEIYLMFDKTLLKTHTHDELEKETEADIDISKETTEADWKSAKTEEQELKDEQDQKLKDQAYDIVEDLLQKENADSSNTNNP
jgi:segregation and condensation protein A